MRRGHPKALSLTERSRLGPGRWFSYYQVNMPSTIMHSVQDIFIVCSFEATKKTNFNHLQLWNLYKYLVAIHLISNQFAATLILAAQQRECDELEEGGYCDLGETHTECTHTRSQLTISPVEDRLVSPCPGLDMDTGRYYTHYYTMTTNS